MIRLRWTRRASVHLDDIGRHIAGNNPAAAGRVVKRIIDLVSNLSEQPKMGRSGRVKGTRELIVPEFPYVIAYREHAQEVQILAVFHALRRWPTKL